MKKILILAVLALVLTGCYHQKTNQAPNGALASPKIESSGDVDKELESIDKELQDAEKEDLPPVDEKTLGL